MAGRATPSVSAIGEICAKYAISAGPPMYVAVGRIARSTMGRSRTFGLMSSVTLCLGADFIGMRFRLPEEEVKTSDKPATSWT